MSVPASTNCRFLCALIGVFISLVKLGIFSSHGMGRSFLTGVMSFLKNSSSVVYCGSCSSAASIIVPQFAANADPHVPKRRLSGSSGALLVDAPLLYVLPQPYVGIDNPCVKFATLCGVQVYHDVVFSLFPLTAV